MSSMTHTDGLTLKQLFIQINIIREKASEAEAIVKAITSDIQRLDVAKRNLTWAIQTIERWGMLSELELSMQRVELM